MTTPRDATHTAGFWGHAFGYVPQSRVTSESAARDAAQGWARKVRHCPYWIGAYCAEPDGEIHLVGEDGRPRRPKEVPE